MAGSVTYNSKGGYADTMMNDSRTPLDRRFVVGWAGATALGWAITALGSLPNLTSLDFTGIAVDDYRQRLWLVLLIGVGWAALGGLVMAAFQARLLRGYGYAVERRAVGWLVLGWGAAWSALAGVVLLLQSTSDATFFPMSSTLLKPMVIQFSGLLLAWAVSSRTSKLLAFPKTLAGHWYRWNYLVWVLGLFGYWLLHRLGESRVLPERLLSATVIGLLIGLALAVGLRWILSAPVGVTRRFPRAALLVPLGILTVLGVLLGAFGLCFLRGCSDPWPPRPAASWATQLAVAQAAAGRLDAAAVPEGVIAYPPAFRVWNADFQTLQIHFNFENTALQGSDSVEVGFLDTAPAATVRSKRVNGGYVSSTTVDDAARLQRSLTQVRISAADALQAALPAIHSITQHNPGMVTANLSLSLTGRDQAGDTTRTTPVWNAIYIIYGSPTEYLDVSVDAQSGAILAHKEP